MTNKYIDEMEWPNHLLPIQPGSWEEWRARLQASRNGETFDLEKANGMRAYIRWKVSNWRGMNAASLNRHAPTNENGGAPYRYYDIAGVRLWAWHIVKRYLRTGDEVKYAANRDDR